jgi:WD40 repeat protein
MSRISRALFPFFCTLITAGVILSALDVTAQDKNGKKDDKKEVKDKKEAKDKDVKDKKEIKDKDVKDKKEIKDKDIKDKKEEKKEFKLDIAAYEFKYTEKDKDKTHWVYDVAFGADGKTIAASYRDRAVRIWELGAKNVKQTLVLPKDAKAVGDFKSLIFANDQIYVGSGKLIKTKVQDKDKKEKEVVSRVGEIKSWDAKSGKQGKALTGHTGDIEALATTKDGMFMASASDDNTVKIWKLAEGKESQTLKGHADSVISVCFSPDGKQVVTTSRDKTLRVWDVEGAKEIASFKVERMVETKDAKGKVTQTKELGREFTHAVFTKDGMHVIAGNLDGVIKIYAVGDKKESQELKAHEGIWALALSPDGSKFATGGYDQTIKIWDTATRKQLKSINAHLGNVTALSFSPDGQWLASGSIDGTVKVWAVNKK